MHTVTIGDVEIDGWEEFRWKITAGVDPDVRTIVVSDHVAVGLDEIRKAGQPVDLVMSPIHEDAYKVSVYVLKIWPDDAPFKFKVQLADRRWLWGRKSVYRTYNVRRRTADVRLNLAEGGRIEQAIPTGDVRWQKWSLYPPPVGTRPWTIKEIIFDLAKAVDNGIDWIVPDTVTLTYEPKEHGLQLENFEIDDYGDTALNRLLHFLPSFDIRLNPDGSAEFYREFGGEEQPQVDRVQQAMYVGAPLIDMVSYSAIRPPYIDVLFTREPEIRFDFNAEQGSLSDLDKLVSLQNVMRMPDITASIRGKDYARSSWVVLDDFLSYIATDSTVTVNGAALTTKAVPPGAKEFGPMSQDNLRRFWSGGFGEVAFAYVNGEGVPDAIWDARINELTSAWRHKFRLHPEGKDRIYTFRPYRAAIIDPENGVRAPACVYTDYTNIPTRKGAVRHSQLKNPFPQGWVVDDGWASQIADAKIAPYDVEVIDEENGIIAIIPRVDPWGLKRTLLPGEVAGNKVMSLSPFDVKLMTYHHVLKSGWRMAIVMTAVQASPNDESRLFSKRVTAKEIGSILGVEIGDANGPPMQIRVGPAGGWWTAKFAWDDARAEEIKEGFFGVTDRKGEIPRKFPDDLIVNANEINILAKSAAAKVYSTMLDRNEGVSVVPWFAGAYPEGRITSLVHELARNGDATSLVACPPYRGAIDAWAFMPDSMRKYLMRQVQPS